MQTDSRIIPQDLNWQEYDVEQESTKVRPAADFMDDVIASYYAEAEQAAGWDAPWERAVAKGLRYRRQELTLYAGHSGSYKSMLQSQVAIHLMRGLTVDPAKCLIASFEMRPRKTLHRMVRQAAGTETPAIQYMKMFKEYTTGKLWLYDHLGQVSARKVLAVCRYAATELGVEHFFIDSLMKVVDKVDDLSEQKKFVGDLISFAQANDAHVHLVAHTRKPPAGGGKQTKHDVHGAGEIEKQSDNVWIIQRNRDKGDDPLKADEPDVYIGVDKQRDGEYEGTLGLGFNAQSLCITNDVGGRWPALALGD